MRRYRDDDGWGYVTTEETWAEAIAATIVLGLIVVSLLVVLFTFGTPVR